MSVDSILSQMRLHGLPDPALPLDTSGKKKMYGPGKKAWYRITEWTSPKTGKQYYFGYFGHKDQYWEIEVDHVDLTPEEKLKFARERREAEEREAKKRADEHVRAANRAKGQWERSLHEGASPYFERKGVKPESCRFMVDAGWEGWAIVPMLCYDSEPARLVGVQKISPDGEKRFNAGIDMVGAACRLGPRPTDGAPIILAEGYATALSLRMALPDSTVFMCVNAGNLLPVARILRKRFPSSPFIFAADDDYLPTKHGNDNHTGRLQAEAAATAVGNAQVVLPLFSVARRAVRDDDSLPQLTDFNDLHVAEGLDAVAMQLVPLLAHVSADSSPPLSEVMDEGAPSAAENIQEGGGAIPLSLGYLIRHVAVIAGTSHVWDSVKGKRMKMNALSLEHTPEAVKMWRSRSDKRVMPEEDVKRLERDAQAKRRTVDNRYGEVLNRYVHLDGSESIFDLHLHQLISQSAMRLAVGDLYTEWVNNPCRTSIPFVNVVFDPTQQKDPAEFINMFRGIPTKPAQSPAGCEAIVELVAHLTNGDSAIFHWLMCWLAYPLQNVGAKMATAVLMHGDVHGTGKSLFFEECVKAIYGEYGATLGQHQLDSQYTGWSSKKLFCLFEELFSSSQRYSATGVLKHMITGKTHQIEKKFVDSFEEANHMNCVFLSNAHQPFHVEASDRRYAVIWPEGKLPEALQKAVEAELKANGMRAFYAYLLAFPLGDFGPHTKPPITAAKQRLIDYGLSTWEVFWEQWQTQTIPVPFTAVPTRWLHDLYYQWCNRGRESKPISLHKFSSLLSTRVPKVIEHWRSGYGKGQQTFFLAEKPPKDSIRQDWLGLQMEAFKDSAEASGWNVQDWR